MGSKAVFHSMIVAAVAALLAGCHFVSMNHNPFKAFDDPAIYRYADEVVDIIRQKDVDGLVQRFHPDLIPDENPEGQFGFLFHFLPSGADVDFNLNFAAFAESDAELGGEPIYAMVYDVVGEENFAQMMLAFTPVGGKCCVITNWKIETSDVLPSTKYALSLEGRSWVHYGIYLLMFVLPVLCLVTAVAAGFNKQLRRKWLWIPFILVGLWGVDFNWTTGEFANRFFDIEDGTFGFYLFRFDLFAIGTERESYFDPWIISVGIPLGAILYWIKYARGSFGQEAGDTVTEPALGRREPSFDAE